MKGQFPEIIKLGDLNGQNGFKLDGEVMGDLSGNSVSAAGDINSDGYDDLLIGAPQCYSSPCTGSGRSYVVFGGPGVGSSGVIALSNLNGANGFKLNGENNQDQSGYSVSAAGDINGDGYADLLIGALGYPSGNTRGRSYVMFGGPGVGNSGTLVLSSLNGVNGFKLDGENNADFSGFAVSTAGDINDDGCADLLIGAWGYPGYPKAGAFEGRSYAVFGSSKIGNSGIIALSSLIGTNGFKLDGEDNGGDFSGRSVSAAGDINDDGVADILIGAYGYPSSGVNRGRSYVVFGGLGVGSSGLVALSGLNGGNGFKLDGEAAGDYSGASVSAGGDINGDGIADLLIGALYHASKRGRSYVVFGGTGVGGSGLVALSGLNGGNGFKLDGEATGDYSGCSVSAAGDINGDGFTDLLIGAYGHASNTGCSYVVFGGPGAGGSGLVALSGLNGGNGFKLDGEVTGDYSGFSVKAGGDINGDGVADLLIGAPYHASQMGRSYVVFGDAPPILVNNSLSIYSGEALQLTAENLAAYDSNHDNHTLLFIPSGIIHGRFESVNFPGVALSNFTQQAITDQTIQFVHDGSSQVPAYDIMVRSSGIAWTGPYPANVTLETLLINANQLVVNQGQAIIFTANNLQATYQGKGDGSISFLIANLEHGRFEWTTVPGQAILTFQQQNITDGMVRFVHDGTDSAPAYQVSVSQGSINTSFQAASIDFDANPVLLNNCLVINQGQSVALTSETLSANHSGSTDDSELQFNISVVQQGQFSWISSPQNPLTSFYQQNITDGLVQFIHDGSVLAPAYNASVTDGRTRSLPQAAQIDFDAIPIMSNNTLRINQGENILITSDILSATHPTGDESILLFNLPDIVHGQFTWVDFPDESITNFYQQNISDHRVQFMHDDSVIAPAYTVSVTDGRTRSAFQAAQISFDTIPVLLNNHLRINQGETVSITSELLSATHPGSDDNERLQFNFINVTHGQFHGLNSPTDALVSFYQQNITDGLIQFTHDNSTQAPAYSVSVTDGRTVSPIQAATIDFDASPILMNNTLVIDQGQTVLLTPAILSAVHPGGDDSLLWFNISEVQQGKFSLITMPDQSIFNFYQQNISDRVIQFSHDNSTTAPSYFVSVSDGRITLPPIAATVDFDVFPILKSNQLVINQGQTVVLGADNLHATHAGSADGNLDFIISDCQHGQFQWTTAPQASITVFKQQNITDQLVQFVHDNSTSAPMYRVAVSDGRLTTVPLWSVIDFDQCPVLVNNKLTIGEDETITLTPDNLSAIHNGTTESNLIFIISNVINGGFVVAGINQPLMGDLTFLQQQVLDQAIRFSQQGSGKPAYQVSVTDGRITLPPTSANVTFYVKPVLTQNQFLVSTGQSALLTSANLAATRAGEIAEDLQFLVSSVSHGHFEKRSNPNVDILSFYQKDVMQQSIQFVADNSTQIPDCRLKVWDSSTDLASDIQETGIILVMNNHFRINQGDMVPLTEEVLKATGNRGDDGDILFTPILGTVQHGQFELLSNPDYPLMNFQQKQIIANEIVFVSENVTSTPSAYLTISDQAGGIQGTVACQIDFDAAPSLQNAYLSTHSGYRDKITDVNLKAASSTSPVNELIFEISENSHLYFAKNDQWQVELNNFTQQQVTDGSIIFVTDDSGVTPKFKVSVSDGRMHCWACPQPADVVFDGSTPSDSSLSETLKNAVIGAAVSGVMGLLFFALRYRHSLSLQRNARPMIDGEEQDTYSDALLLPIAREIFSRIKITGCLGYIGKRQYNEYVGAVSVIVAALETKGVIQPETWNSLSRPKKQKIIDAIAMHTKELIGNNRCCSTRTFTGFYRAEVTPRMIRDQANAIADAVQETLTDSVEAKGSNQRGVRLTRVSSSLNDSGLTAPLLK